VLISVLISAPAKLVTSDLASHSANSAAFNNISHSYAAVFDRHNPTSRYSWTTQGNRVFGHEASSDPPVILTLSEVSAALITLGCALYQSFLFSHAACTRAPPASVPSFV
jgi:hypothetical protein